MDCKKQRLCTTCLSIGRDLQAQCVSVGNGVFRSSMADAHARLGKVLFRAILRSASELQSLALRHALPALLVQDLIPKLQSKSGLLALPELNWTGSRKELLSAIQAACKVDSKSGACTSARYEVDIGFTALHIMTDRLAALRKLTTCTRSVGTEGGLMVQLEAKLNPDRCNSRHGLWFYGYDATFTNNGNEPVELLRKSWSVVDLAGRRRRQTNYLVPGTELALAPGETKTVSAAVTLDSIQGALLADFEAHLKTSGKLFLLQMPPVGLIPAPEQLESALVLPRYM